MEHLLIDGNAYEGGGQMLRLALALSMITRKPFKMTNIRGNRQKPGLKPQHMSILQWFKENSSAKIDNAKLGSREIAFFPGDIAIKKRITDIGTAGAITLFLEGITLPLLCNKIRTNIKVKGGTDVKYSPTIDYFSNAFLELIEFHADIKLDVLSRGYYPEGGGTISLKLKDIYDMNYRHVNCGLNNIQDNKSDNKSQDDKPCKISTSATKSLDFANKGSLISAKVFSNASSNLRKANVAERQARIAKLGIKQLIEKYRLSRYEIKVDTYVSYSNTISKGSSITAVLAFKADNCLNRKTIIAADNLGEKGKTSEGVAQECISKLEQEIKANSCVDANLADMLIPYIALFGGSIKTSRLTKHIESAIYICENFLDINISIKENKEEGNIIISA